MLQTASRTAGQLGSWAAGQLGSWAAGQLGSWAAGQMGSWAAGQLGSWAAGQMGRWAAGQLGGWADGQLGRWAAKQSILCTAPCCPRGSLVHWECKENLFNPALVLQGLVRRCLVVCLVPHLMFIGRLLFSHHYSGFERCFVPHILFSVADWVLLYFLLCCQFKESAIEVSRSVGPVTSD